MTQSLPPHPPSPRPVPPPVRLWRDRAHLIVRRNATIPGPACLRCGTRGTGAGTVVSALGDRIQVPMCARHIRDLERSRTLGPGLVTAGVVAVIAGGIFDSVLVALPGLYLAVGSLIATAIGKNGLSLVASDPYFIRLSGVDSRFLERQRRWDDYADSTE